MNIKNAISAVLLALSAILLILILNAPLAQSVSGMLPAITPTTSRLVLIGNLAGVPVHAAVQDHYAYLIDEARRITVVDIQTPTMPFTVGVGSYSECYSPPHCFPWYPAMGRLVISGTYLYVPLFSLRIVDVSDPAHPVEAGSTTQHYLSAVVVKGHLAYAINDRDYLDVIDVSNPLAPTEILTYPVPGLGYYMALNGDYVYISRSDAVHVLNISKPLSPTEVSSYPINTISGGPLAVTNHYAYVSENATLHVLNISNPTQITETGRYTASSFIWSVTAAEPYVYIFTGDTGAVHALDVSDPIRPTEIASFLFPNDRYNDVLTANGYVLVPGGSGLTILRLMTHLVFLPLVWR